MRRAVRLPWSSGPPAAAPPTRSVVRPPDQEAPAPRCAGWSTRSATGEPGIMKRTPASPAPFWKNGMAVLAALLVALTIGALAVAQNVAVLSSDKQDYYPGSSVKHKQPSTLLTRAAGVRQQVPTHKHTPRLPAALARSAPAATTWATRSAPRVGRGPAGPTPAAPLRSGSPPLPASC
jgi:hypothetical protein